jgi:VanZ family protein
MVIIFSFGLTIEIVHYFHPYRYFEWADLLANFLGIILAGAIHKTLQKT